MSRPRLRLLGRAECGLCEEMLEALQESGLDQRLQLEVCAVDADPLWQRRWGLKIPVLLADDGEPVCVSRFDADALQQWLDGAARGP
ncbi:MAG TPA: glutaredoxin family protein [Nevskiaceae bacterium]|nr:glutaredoxin family protein [Nevskiaceae bacterium]